MTTKIKQSSNRSFGIVFSIVFILIGFWPILNNSDIRLWSIIIGLIFLILGMLKSNILSPLNFVWTKFGVLLGIVIAPLVMGILFLFVVTPTGIIMKLLGKDLLKLKKTNKNSYWIEKKDPESSMKNQF